MKKTIVLSIYISIVMTVFNCSETQKKHMSKTPSEILGNSNYLAMSYGGYRDVNHDIEPTIKELKEDVKILSAMGVGILRTYKLHLPHAFNLVKAIRELKEEDSEFEMYVMLGAWIDCKNAWTDQPLVHHEESERNAVEIASAVKLANEYPDIIKVIAVGNEAMVKWQAGYYVEAGIILKWVNHLQDLKKTGKLSKNVWITSSDNFASWGGGEDQYHVDDLNKLIHAVDFISMHTYPMHDTHYNPEFWGVPDEDKNLSNIDKINARMSKSIEYAITQYNSVKAYMEAQGAEKPIHIGETGWATFSNGFYGAKGAKATDEYKEAKFHKLIRDWTNKNNISCFYFEAFDEPWKDGQNPGGSENHFGLFTVDGKAKYALWDLVDKGIFKGLGRNGKPVIKTYNGNKEALMIDVLMPPTEMELMKHN